MEMRQYIEQVAHEAGALTIAGWETLDHTGGVHSKDTDKDIVTAVDRQVEDFIVSKIHAKYPDHNIFGEEAGFSSKTNSPYEWVIDPIDGTATYEHGGSDYTVSIGLTYQGVPVRGWVFAPKLNEMFYGEQGKGAYLNGEPIHVSRRAEFGKCIGETGFACLRAKLPKNNLKTFCTVYPQCRELMRNGSAALAHCYIAAGRFDFGWEFPLKIYDICASTIIVREAGGRVTDFDGGDDWPEKGIISSNGLIHEHLRAIIKETDYRS